MIGASRFPGCNASTGGRLPNGRGAVAAAAAAAAVWRETYGAPGHRQPSACHFGWLTGDLSLIYDRPFDRPTYRSTEWPTDRSTDESTDRPTNRLIDRPTERSTDRPTDWPINRSTDQPTDRLSYWFDWLTRYKSVIQKTLYGLVTLAARPPPRQRWLSACLAKALLVLPRHPVISCRVDAPTRLCNGKALLAALCIRLAEKELSGPVSLNPRSSLNRHN